MAAINRATVESTKPSKQGGVATTEARDPWAQVARLSRLHDEAAETALLANLLGRVPYLAAGLAIATGTVAVLAHAEIAPLLTWLILVGAGVIALTRSYLTSIAAPFERAALQVFARDLQAILLYVGFAWGAGSFLALPGDVTILPLLLFSAGASAYVAVVARQADVTICFALPATILCAMAAAVRPFDNTIVVTSAILGAGLLLMGAALSLGRLFARPQAASSLPLLPAE